MSIVAYIGNFVPEHSTENHVRQAWINQGHQVIRIQEGYENDYNALMTNMKAVDLVLWTRTGDLAAKWGHAKQIAMLGQARELDIPTVAFHLDRWWGLDREHLIYEEPFFRCQYVITADGGHQEEFNKASINHYWLPPAVSLNETEPGEYQERYASDIAFVGSWMPGYHREWKHRPQLIDWLSKTYPHQVKFWPRPNEHSVRGKDLRDLYASVKVVVGDSCLVGNAAHYWSDRIPETLGRGGFLIHPYVKGLEEHFTIGHYGDLVTWQAGNWEALRTEIDWFLDHPFLGQEVAARGRATVIEKHTYDVRVNQILELIT